MVRHAPIHRRSGHSDIAICCGRNVRGSSPSTSVVPLSNQVTTLNHKRFKGFKMFSDGHLVTGRGMMIWVHRPSSVLGPTITSVPFFRVRTTLPLPFGSLRTFSGVPVGSVTLQV